MGWQEQHKTNKGKRYELKDQIHASVMISMINLAGVI